MKDFAGRRTRIGKRGLKKLSSKRHPSLKNRIRDVERLLRKDSLPATVRSEKERELKALKFEVENKKTSLREVKYSKKYRMLRFFEKRKLIRKIEGIEKIIKKLEENNERNLCDEKKAELFNLKVDFNYITYFPKRIKYISLFPNTSTDEPKVIELREKIRNQVRTAMTAGKSLDLDPKSFKVFLDDNDYKELPKDSDDDSQDNMETKANDDDDFLLDSDNADQGDYSREKLNVAFSENTGSMNRMWSKKEYSKRGRFGRHNS